MKRIFALCGATAIALGAGLYSAWGAQNTGPVVAVTGGQVRGTIEDGEGVFRGIPYVAPPVGNLRWKAPRPVVPWTGVREATKFSPSCMQNFDFGPMSENCLTLNVWSPDWPSKTPKAVMVWFHGGGDTAGGSNSLYFYGDILAKRGGVVVVSVNYRLGALGFMALPELTAESPHHASGNYGLLDQIAALKWVKANIAAFGGDPNRVTIFGQSAGAADVERLMVSPLSTGLFQRAIGESGALRRYDPPLKQMEQECAAIANDLGAPKKNRLAFLRRVSAKAILDASGQVNGCRPINIDGYVLTEQPLKTWSEGREHKLPFILGGTPRESYEQLQPQNLRVAIEKRFGAMASKVFAAYGLENGRTPPVDPFYGSAYMQFGADYNNRCRVMMQGVWHAAIGAPFYQFQFERLLPGQKPLAHSHSNDVPFVFGLPFRPRYRAVFDAMDRKTSDQIERYWTNFAKTGDPNGPGLPAWNKYGADARPYMAFGKRGAMPSKDLRRPICDLFMQAEEKEPTWSHPERSARW